MRSFPFTPLSTKYTGWKIARIHASDAKMQMMTWVPIAAGSAKKTEIGANRHREKRIREARCPKRTATVIFPVALSVGMSRMLLTMSIATDIRPKHEAMSHSHQGAEGICVHVVPTVAISPKKTKTKSSDRPIPI